MGLITPWTGKADNVAYLFLMSIGRLYAAAPTHIATTNMANRLDNLGRLVSKDAGQSHVPLIVRGYRIEIELEVFRDLITGTDLG